MFKGQAAFWPFVIVLSLTLDLLDILGWHLSGWHPSSVVQIWLAIVTGLLSMTIAGFILYRSDDSDD